MAEQADGKTEGEEPKRRNSIELQKVETTTRDSNLSNQPAKAAYSRPEVIYSPEKTRAWMFCLQFGLLAFNVIIWLFGAVITGVGIWLAADPDFWSYQLNLDMVHFRTGAYVAIAVGVIIITIGLIGCLGAIKQSICCLSIYIAIAILIVILEIATVGIVWSAVNNKDMQDKISSLIKKGIEKRKESPASVYFIDKMQHELQCCGFQGPDEYDVVVPRSCLSESGEVQKRGCMKVVIEFFKDKAAIIGGVVITTLLFQIGAIIFTICLICGIRQGKKAVF